MEDVSEILEVLENLETVILELGKEVKEIREEVNLLSSRVDILDKHKQKFIGD